jgi:hypothetical protein
MLSLLSSWRVRSLRSIEDAIKKDIKKGRPLAERPRSRADIQRADNMDDAPRGVRMAIAIIMLFCC